MEISKVYAEKGGIQWSDLSEELKGKMLEKFRYCEVESEQWCEPIIEYWKERLEKIGFINSCIQFSGSYNQGDGASFTSNVDMQTLVSTLIYCEPRYSTIYDSFQFWTEINAISAKVYRYNRQYCHENTCGIDMKEYIDIPIKYYNFMKESIESLRKILCVEIYIDLEKYYDELTSDDFLIQVFIENKTDFSGYFNLHGELM